jgi:hypothetical protein
MASAEPLMRARIVQELENHFHARVELDSFHLTLRRDCGLKGKGCESGRLTRLKE